MQNQILNWMLLGTFLASIIIMMHNMHKENKDAFAFQNDLAKTLLAVYIPILTAIGGFIVGSEKVLALAGTIIRARRCFTTKPARKPTSFSRVDKLLNI